MRERNSSSKSQAPGWNWTTLMTLLWKTSKTRTTPFSPINSQHQHPATPVPCNMHTTNILSVNMWRQNVTMHTLLEENEEDDILCVQEPWFGKIGTARKDTAKDGVDVLGGASHHNWNLVCPYFNNKQCAKVMIYICKHSRLASKRRLHPVRTVPRLDIVRHHSIMITDFHIQHKSLHIINFYHDIEDKTCLSTLTSLDLDPTVPTILVGDFNLHSPRWSPRGWSPSPQISGFETWAASQSFELATVPSEITWRGLKSE